eukprot:CAMPEP_0118650460 /NCGR_PEP_ID=MMETSP0785-20121206/10261_1 /TAXON_ID=91992 /ORGANISM="Bolidomonas pacifica, Strain CCMP 1866" /LENGTH=393 /DNA_ID=CAMNT_0006542841 /DNA_START=821 /DNA_END=1999 /DNA_ORIENTATION=+
MAVPKNKPKPPPRRTRPVTRHADGTSSFKVSGTSFRVNSKFSPLGIVGKGSYGVVCAAINSKTGEKVAIKKIEPMCEDVWDAKHTLRELRLMRLLDYHPNVISLVSLSSTSTSLYIVMELMDSDLHKIVQSKQKLGESHLKVIWTQILSGVSAMHRNNVFHRDLKPGNILVSRDCQVRITDFGLARSMSQNDDIDSSNPASAMTEYVVTRWYRCPELLLAPHVAYTSKVDLWSVGCIFAEMVLREPLFPGRSYVHQVQLILETIGLPPSEQAMGFTPRKDAAAYLKRQKVKVGKNWGEILPGSAPDVVDLISGLLVFNPSKRSCAEDAMKHPYFEGTPELPCEKEGKTPGGRNFVEPQEVDFGFDNDKIGLEELKDMIQGEVEICRMAESERG